MSILTSIPCPLSVIWSSFNPPSLTTTSNAVEPASTAFSISSFNACTGATMISPAAILLTTSCARALIRRGAGSGRLSSPFRFVPRGGDEGEIFISSAMFVQVEEEHRFCRGVGCVLGPHRCGRGKGNDAPHFRVFTCLRTSNIHQRQYRKHPSHVTDLRMY
jgi:hypothetical protein